jgi:hypothetical protein
MSKFETMDASVASDKEALQLLQASVSTRSSRVQTSDRVMKVHRRFLWFWEIERWPSGTAGAEFA